MRHFVTYHNTEKMGLSYEECTPFSVATTKAVDGLLGNRVWSIVGSGAPRRYALHDTYLVDRTGTTDQDEFTNFAEGSTGLQFDPPILLNELPWFRDFLLSQGNFGLGLQPIQEKYVVYFEQLAAAATGETGRYPDEMQPVATYHEGAVRQVTVNAYERNPVARQRCVAHHGAHCCICGRDFGTVYGPVAEGFIHVHHLRTLAAIGETYEVDPIEDLRPVCPNCHAVIHLHGQVRSIEEVQRLLAEQRSR